MQDQVHKLNSLVPADQPDIATFLGSAQTDASVEQRLADYRLIYVTPEKLLAPNFIRHHLVGMPLALVAVDEAHCVSEWGFDFRPVFRQVGTALREELSQDIPLLALTATAVPRVRRDILESLKMRDPVLVHQQSFDRPNLRIRVAKKTGGLPGAMKDLLKELNGAAAGTKASASHPNQSTIVYAPTRSQVEEVAQYLQAHTTRNIRVEAYHAGLSNAARADAHTNFLTGQTAVIVATVAFGMGIDKPDTRRVIHYGCPKTLEEYYQQIGRAGRDGLPAHCTMFVSESDFDRYQSDFYLGGLTGTARRAVESSMAALRQYSLDGETCRRRALLEYFDETPSFGARCGTCDTCLAVATYGADAQRDFGPRGARVVLQAVAGLRRQGLSSILKVVTGGVVEGYRYQPGFTPARVQQLIQASRDKLDQNYPQTYYRELMAPLKQKDYLTEATETKTVGGYQRSWTTYSISPAGARALAQSLPVVLPVPESVREVERLAEEKRQKVLAELEQNGIQRDKLPQEEVEKGDGEVIRAYRKWHTYLDNLQKAGRDERVAQLESLLAVIEGWRSATAVKQRMAPASVLAEHLLVSIAYTVATLPPGLRVDADSLVAAGVRTREIGALVGQLGEWVEQVQPAAAAADGQSGAAGAASGRDPPMVLAEIHPSKPWQYAVYKPQKKTGMMVWEMSYNRFAKGESPQTIAVAPANGRQPIQVKTVVGHILDAILHGRSVDLRRLNDYMPAPSQSEWEKLNEAALLTGMDVTGDPNNSGRDGEKFVMTEYIRPIIGDRVADLPYNERSEADRELLGKWFDALKWYMTSATCWIRADF